MTPFEYLKKEEQNSLGQLKELLRIPSISAQSQYEAEVARCAEWVAGYMTRIGISAKTMETGGHPVVFGQYRASAKAPTILIYGHYDVQPVDPPDLWHSGPFEPVEKDGYLIARGAADDKGQFFAHLKGVEAYLKTVGALPLNVKFLIEGEEEAGTENLDRFIRQHADLLAADVVVVSDTAQYNDDIPAIDFGLRGIASVEVKVTGPDRDLHSGGYGGAVANPINILARLIGQLHDDKGRVTVDGFYDKVYTMSAWEKEQYAQLPFKEDEFIKLTGVPALWGEKGYGVLERIWVRPTLDCNGITGGYQGEGGKTIIPSWASAKITMRLVPEMDPKEISDKFEAHLKKICPDSVRLEVTKHGGAKPIQVPVDSPWLKAAAHAVEEGFGVRPYFIKEGGSIPVVEKFKSVLGLDTLLIGLSQPDNNAHSPNEKLLLRSFHRGCRVSVALFEALSHVKA